MDDLGLARALAAGDEEAFRRLVDQETSAVFRTCYRILGRVDDAAISDFTMRKPVMSTAVDVYDPEDHGCTVAERDESNNRSDRLRVVVSGSGPSGDGEGRPVERPARPARPAH